MEVSKAIELDYGHTLPNHFSFCNQIHGHRAKIVAHVSGQMITKENDSSQGMIMDFKIVKDIMMTKIHKVLDHGFAVWEKDTETKEYILKRNKVVLVTELPPTAEVLARWAHGEILAEFNARKLPCHLFSVEWYETPTSIAAYP